MKLETMEDLDLCSSHKEVVKEKAIKWFLYGMKKRKNLARMFLDFHNIEMEDLK